MPIKYAHERLLSRDASAGAGARGGKQAATSCGATRDVAEVTRAATGLRRGWRGRGQRLKAGAAKAPRGRRGQDRPFLL